MANFFDRYKNHTWCKVLGHWWQGYHGPTKSGEIGPVFQYCEYCGEKRVIEGTCSDWY